MYIYDTADKTTPLGVANSSAVIHPAGTVVPSRDAGVGKSAIMGDEMAVSQHFMAWQCSPQLNNHLLYYWLQVKKPEFERIAIGNTIKTIGLSYFKQLKIPLPPLPEQRSIAQTLSDVDALIAALDKMIAKKRAIKTAAMQQLLTGKKRLPGFGEGKSYKESAIGLISEDWDVKLLGEVFSLGNGFSLKSEYFSSNGPIALTPGNFKLEGGLYFNDRNTRRYAGDFPKSIVFQNRDLLVVMTDLTPDCNLLGKPAFVNLEEKILHNQHIGKIQLLSESFDKQFLYFTLLSSLYLKRIKEKATGSTVRHTSNRSIYSVSLLIPNQLEEQRAIATVLSDMNAEIAALETRLAKTQAIKQGMMQELLTGKTRLV